MSDQYWFELEVRFRDPVVEEESAVDSVVSPSTMPAKSLTTTEEAESFFLDQHFKMGISRDSYHKRRATGGKKAAIRKKRKYELGYPAANTKIGASRINFVRTRGGNRMFRTLRLYSEGTARKARTINVVYNASTNELVRTKTLVKNAIIVIDASLFHQWYESHYLLHQGKKVGEEDVLTKKRSKRVMK